MIFSRKLGSASSIDFSSQTETQTGKSGTSNSFYGVGDAIPISWKASMQGGSYVNKQGIFTFFGMTNSGFCSEGQKVSFGQDIEKSSCTRVVTSDAIGFCENSLNIDSILSYKSKKLGLTRQCYTWHCQSHS